MQKGIENKRTAFDSGNGSELGEGAAEDSQGVHVAQNKSSKQSRQAKKTDKTKIKENEQGEQLKLARSPVSGLERRLEEAENTNKILRQEITLSTNRIGKSSQTESSLNSPGNDGSRRRESRQNTSHTYLDSAIITLKENVRIIEL